MCISVHDCMRFRGIECVRVGDADHGRFRCSALKKKSNYLALFITDFIFDFYVSSRKKLPRSRSSRSVKDLQFALVTTWDREGPAHTALMSSAATVKSKLEIPEKIKDQKE